MSHVSSRPLFCYITENLLGMIKDLAVNSGFKVVKVLCHCVALFRPELRKLRGEEFHKPV